jgi:hypothetical protein
VKLLEVLGALQATLGLLQVAKGLGLNLGTAPAFLVAGGLLAYEPVG